MTQELHLETRALSEHFSIISVPAHSSESGVLRALDFEALPFRPQRCFWVTAKDPDIQRGGHAHREQAIALWCPKGCVEVKLCAHGESATLRLTPTTGILVIEPGVCATQTYESPDSLLMALCSGAYDPKEYSFACQCLK